MVFKTIPPTDVDVGSPIDEKLTTTIKEDLDDLDARTTANTDAIATFTAPSGGQKPPQSISVKISSYTIPIGFFARVVCNVIGSSYVTINGSTAISSAQFLGLGLNATIYTMGTGALNSVNGASVNAVYNTQTHQGSDCADYLVPEGTVISGSGTWRATIEIYPN